MNYLLALTELVNIIAILLFTAGLFFVCGKDVNTKHKAFIGVSMGLVMLVYLSLLGLSMIALLFQGKFLALTLLFFIIIPFPLGHFSKFETVKLFTVLQILCFVLSLGVLYLI